MTITLNGSAEEIEVLRAEIVKLRKINSSLIDRVERSTDLQGSAFTMFETAISLEAMVRDRTSALEEAMSTLATVNAELANANAETDAARKRLRDAIESINEGFALFDAEDRLVLCNDAYLGFWPEVSNHLHKDLTFHDIAKLVAQSQLTIGSMVAPDRWVSDRLAKHSIAKGGHVQALADGRWVQINELRTSEGGIVGIYTDITEVKAEEARERALELAEKSIILQTTLDTIPQGVAVFDRKRELVAWNGPLLTIVGLEPDEIGLVQTHEALMATCIRTFGPVDIDAALAWLSDGTAETLSLRQKKTGGVLEVRRALMPDGGMVMSFADVTERFRTAEALERRIAERTMEAVEAKTAAEQANRSKTSFIAAASHDLLQPLNAARLFTSALAERRLALPTRALVNQTVSALESIEDLLEALLEISRLDAGGIQPEITDFRLDLLLETLRAEFAPLAASANLALVVDSGVYWVRSDMRLLRRILQNFFSNAIRYTVDGSVQAVCELYKDNQLRISVIDTGPGIATSKHCKIFEEFRRLETSRRVSGHGLGLAIVRRASDMLEHKIELRSAPGAGSAFSILVPVGEPKTEIASQGQPVKSGRSMQGCRVLVIDNDSQILNGMRTLLSGWGCNVEIAVSGEQACARIEPGAPIDIIIADYHLDDEKTGDNAVQTICAAAGKPIPAIIISADRTDELRAHLDALSMSLLNKPVKPAQLRALLRTIVK